MKKSLFLVTATVLFTLVLAACSSGVSDETLETPGAFGNDNGLGTPSVGLGTPSTDLGTPSTGAVGTPVGSTPATTQEATTPAVTEEMGTPTISTTEATTSTVGGVTTGITQPDAGRVKDLLSFKVQDKDGNDIGSVKNLVFNLETGKVEYIIINQGGVLGIGADQIAVPCELFTFPTASVVGTSSIVGGSSSNATATPATGSSASTPATGAAGANDEEHNYLVLKVDQSALENAPKFDKTLLPTLGMPAADWDSQLKTYWQENGVSGSTGSTGSTGSSAAATSTPASGGAISTPASGTPENGTPVAPGASGLSMPAGKLQGVVLADQLFDLSLTNANGDKIGEIEDIVIDPTNCKVMYIVISYNNGTQGATLIPIPPAVFQLNGEGRSLVIANADTDLAGAPNFTSDLFPFTLTKDWDKDIKTYWQSHGNSNALP